MMFIQQKNKTKQNKGNKQTELAYIINKHRKPTIFISDDRYEVNYFN